LLLHQYLQRHPLAFQLCVVSALADLLNLDYLIGQSIACWLGHSTLLMSLRDGLLPFKLQSRGIVLKLSCPSLKHPASCGG